MNGGLWCSPVANTSSPTSSAFFAISTVALIRSCSVGVRPVVGSGVTSPTVKMPICMSAHCPLVVVEFRSIYGTTTARRVFLPPSSRAPLPRLGPPPGPRPHGGPARRRRVVARDRAVRRQGVRRPAARLSPADARGTCLLVARQPAPRTAAHPAVRRVHARDAAVPGRRDRQQPRPLRRGRLVGRRQPLRELVPAADRARAAGVRGRPTALGGRARGLRARRDPGDRLGGR